MLGFSKAQEEVRLGSIVIGGQPGRNPTLLLGTVLYGKKYKTLDAEARVEVAGFIKAQRDLSAETGVSQMADVYIPDAETAQARLSLVAECLEQGEFISIDVPESEARIAALQALDEMGMLGRTLMNSLNLGVTEPELRALANHKPHAAILLAYDPRDLSAQGRLRMITQGTKGMDRGLLDIARGLGIAALIDSAATPFDHMAAETLRAIPVLKQELGLPVGCSIHNTVESWPWMKERRKTVKEAFLYADVGSAGLPLALGADYLVYGPMRNAPQVFPFVAFVDKLVAEGAGDYFGVEPAEGHPWRKLK